MEKDNRQTPEDKFRYYSGAIRRDMGNLLKWLLLAFFKQKTAYEMA